MIGFTPRREPEIKAFCSVCGKPCEIHKDVIGYDPRFGEATRMYVLVTCPEKRGFWNRLKNFRHDRYRVIMYT
jgi:hypothetical protein